MVMIYRINLEWFCVRSVLSSGSSATDVHVACVYANWYSLYPAGQSRKTPKVTKMQMRIHRSMQTTFHTEYVPPHAAGRVPNRLRKEKLSVLFTG